MEESERPSFISTQTRQGRYLYLNLNPSWDRPLEVVCAGLERCSPGYHITRAAFPFYAVEFVSQGKGLFRCQGKEHRIDPGSIIVYGPGVAHEIKAEGPSLTKYFIDFAGTEGLPLLRQMQAAPGVHLHLDSSRSIQELFDQIIDSGAHRREFSQTLAPLLLRALLVQIGESAALQKQSQHAMSRYSYERCRDYIMVHFRTLSKASEVSEACALSVTYMTRLFQEFSSETPYKFLVRLKMAEAADLLRRKGASVKETAASVGYDDPYHFSRAFKRHHGAAPLHFRQIYHKSGSQQEAD